MRPFRLHDPSQAAPNTLDFAQDATNVLSKLQSSVSAILRALKDPVTRAADLTRVLEIERVMAWKMYSLATAGNPLAAGPFVLKPRAMSVFLNACRVKGVPATVVNEAESAFKSFQALVERHAPDRASFESMIRDVHGVRSDKDDLKHKRAAFRSARHICGVHADLMLNTLMLIPPVNGRIETIGIEGFLRIQQIRTDTRLLTEHQICSWKKNLEVERSLSPGNRSPSDSDTLGSFKLLSEFGTNPGPDFRATKVSDNLLNVEVFSRGLGRNDAETYFFASKDWMYLSPIGCRIEIYSGIRVPTEACILDIWVHKDFPIIGEPTVGMYMNRSYQLPHQSPRLVDKLTTVEQVTIMPPNPQAALIPELPAYPVMMARLADLAGWSMDDFRLIRCWVQYPFPGSTIQLIIPTDGAIA